MPNIVPGNSPGNAWKPKLIKTAVEGEGGVVVWEEGGHICGEVEGGGVVVECVGGWVEAVRGGGGGEHRLLQKLAWTQTKLRLGGSSREGGGGVGRVGGRVELCLLPDRHHVHALLPLLGHLQVLHDFSRGRAGVVGKVLGEELTEQLFEVRVDCKGSLTRLAWAALVDIVREEQVETFHQLGQVKATPLVELGKRKD